MIPKGYYGVYSYHGWDPFEKRYREFESYSAYIEWWQEAFSKGGDNNECC